MAQADGVVANGSGSAVRADINAQLAAAFTNHSGATEPSDIRVHQFWYDESADILKIRNDDNNGWISLREADGKVILPAGSASAPSIYFTGETSTGFYEAGSGIIVVSHQGAAISVFGKNMTGNQTQVDCFVYGDAATQTLPPGEGDNSSAVAGFQVAKDGVTQIGTYEKRPLVVNRMGTIGGSASLLAFHVNGSFVQHITTDGSTIAYNTGSDYRLKENIVTLTGAKARLNQLRVCRFNFIALPNRTFDGFIAHEAQEVVPEAVTGAKDAVNPDGSPDYQGIDQSKLVPLLTAALQEAFAEIAALTARVETLEAG